MGVALAAPEKKAVAAEPVKQDADKMEEMADEESNDGDDFDDMEMDENIAMKKDAWFSRRRRRRRRWVSHFRTHHLRIVRFPRVRFPRIRVPIPRVRFTRGGW